MAMEIVDLVQLGDSNLAKHGKRYSEAERESAYQIYRSVAGRSTAKVARLTGISERTLDNWRHDHGWAARAEQEAREAAELWSGALSLVVQQQAITSVLTAAQLRDDPDTPPKVRLDASIWLAGLAGVAPVAKSASLTQQVPVPSAPTTPLPSGSSTETTSHVPLTREAAARMTPEERAAWERHRRQQTG